MVVIHNFSQPWGVLVSVVRDVSLMVVIDNFLNCGKLLLLLVELHNTPSNPLVSCNLYMCTKGLVLVVCKASRDVKMYELVANKLTYVF